MIVDSRRSLCRGLFAIPLLLTAGCHLFHGEVPSGIEYAVHPGDPEAARAALESAAELFEEPRTADRAQSAKAAYLEAVSPHTDHEALWRAAEVAAWLAEHHPAPERRREEAHSGAAAAAAAIELDAASPGGHYYRAINLGLLSQLEGGGLNRLEIMERHAREVIRLAPDFEHAGGHRLLGLLIFETLDNLIAARGTFDDALEHLEAACEIAPDYGLNQLSLARLLIDDEDFEGARERLEKTLACPPPEGEVAADREWKREARERLEALEAES